jgi:hypothetical protein
MCPVTIWEIQQQALKSTTDAVFWYVKFGILTKYIEDTSTVQPILTIYLRVDQTLHISTVAQWQSLGAR